MDYFLNHKSELTTSQLHALTPRFESMRSMEDLAQLLTRPVSQVEKLIKNPKYHSFHIPKPGGKKRFIENPQPELKNAQHQLNRYLQAIYHQIKPECAYGFIIRPTDEMYPRNIYFNALKHNKGQWFLNLDLKDFFHHITKQHLHKLWDFPFLFPFELANTLTKLCTKNDRLPMGAPTSPVLSNLVCLSLDYQLEKLAQTHQATYTRYADDLCFSFQSEPHQDFLYEVELILLRENLPLNTAKTRLQKRAEQPEITGLILGKGQKPTLSKAWLKRLKTELSIYQYLMSAAVLERGLFHAFVFDKYQQSLRGQIEFVGFVEGKDSRLFQKLLAKLKWGTRQ